MSTRSFEQRWRRIVSGEESGTRADIARGVLRGLSAVFNGIVRVRYSLYRHGIFSRSWPGCMVISIGNITVGGTGKTPVVEIFARALTRGGRKVAIVSRGYKARAPSIKWRIKNRRFLQGTKVVHDGKKLLLGARVAGDEPYMLARNLENVVVITDKSRVRGSRYAIEKFGVDTIILDDGMQHLPLQRQIEVVLIDAQLPFGYEHLLPRGLLREPLSSLSRATHIFITKARDIDVTPLIRRIRDYNAHAEIIACYYEPVTLVNIHTDAQLPVTALKDQRIVVATGIAQPDGFVSLLRDLGADVVRQYNYPDHHRFRREEIEYLYQRVEKRNADALLITQKDAVRFSRRAGARIRSCPVYYLKVAVAIKKGEKDFINCITRICYP